MVFRFCLAALAAAAFLCAGCASIGPGGAAPGFIFSDVTYPNILNPNMDYRITFERDDIELVGPVEAEAHSSWVLFLFSWGDSGYGSLMDNARSQGADGIMNLTVDTKFKWYMFAYAKITTRLTGMAYKYKR